MTLSDIKKFHMEHFKDKKWNYGIIGSKSKVDMEALKKYGNVITLSLKDIFGFQPEAKPGEEKKKPF
jgi:hypothetical protein